MAQVFTKKLLSGSTNGKQILLTSNANPGQTIHTAVAGTSSFDEIWIYAYNDGPNTAAVVLLWGGTTEPDNKIEIPIPAQAGRVLVADGILLQNSLIVKAYATITAQIVLDGFVNNIT